MYRIWPTVGEGDQCGSGRVTKDARPVEARDGARMIKKEKVLGAKKSRPKALLGHMKASETNTALLAKIVQYIKKEYGPEIKALKLGKLSRNDAVSALIYEAGGCFGLSLRDQSRGNRYEKILEAYQTRAQLNERPAA